MEWPIRILRRELKSRWQANTGKRFAMAQGKMKEQPSLRDSHALLPC